MKRVKSAAEKANDKARRERNREQNKVAVRKWCMRVKYGLTLEDYARLLDQQKGVCAICGSPPRSDRLLAVDHNHATGEVRGLLCNSCNVGIGALGDTVAAVERALQYLKARE